VEQHIAEVISNMTDLHVAAANITIATAHKVNLSPA